MRAVERQDRTVATADQILGEIRDYCRTTQTAESTFGRLVVNDGKLVSRLRDGARITTGTLDKVRAYLSEHRSAPSSAPSKPSAATKPVKKSTYMSGPITVASPIVRAPMRDQRVLSSPAIRRV